ncbi:hypothetical protein [Allorhodopirellula solitaria]|uniref:Uncharacterized protein n=1 Tax=Allorhodopirellula solitaria TaxID=2527987 RepID=A0A5C5XSL3_9BACT|nr:hypothetical protein [Allorhodopirellula solitaria]TWT64682.1 hypothetical protein CA85_38150 [Allorhodopirellula solitaria]
MTKPNDGNPSDSAEPAPGDPIDSEANPASPDDSGSDGIADESKDEGPGCLPAIVAGTLLMGIAAAILCGVTTWILFQKRSEIAVRTLQGFVPVIEQSLLDPDDKAEVLKQFESLIQEMSAPDYPPASAAAIMQRVVRLPIPHWGELDAVEVYVQENYEDAEREQALVEISRVRRAIQAGQATVFDVVDVLEPVAVINDETGSRTIKSKLTPQDVDQVIVRAKLLGDRAKIEDKKYPRIEMSTILRQEIQAAKTEGGF